MKKIPQNFLILFGIIGISVIVTIVFIGFTHTETSSMQREKIHSFKPDMIPLVSPIRMQDMEPNSAVYFMYPPNLSSYGDENHFQKFILIRLPLVFSGDKNDISSFRAFSAVDLASHCLLKYFPDEGRQKIEDPCTSPAYRAVDGISEYWPSTNFLRAPSTGALPKLDLSTDDEGYIYVEPPKFTEDENGVIGVGRKVTQDEFDQGTILEKSMHQKLEEKIASFHFPEILSTGHKLQSIEHYGSIKYGQYIIPDKNENAVSIAIEYCSCSKTYRQILETDGKNFYGSFWQVDNTDIYAVPAKVDATKEIYTAYSFRFYQNGFRVTFSSDLSFDAGMKLVLENYFSDFTLDDVKKIDTD